MRAWIILKYLYLGRGEFDSRSKVFLEESKAQRYLYEVLNDPETKRFMTLGENPYFIKDIEIDGI